MCSMWLLAVLGEITSCHIEHIYTKTGVSNRAQLSVFAMKHGLMGGPQS